MLLELLQLTPIQIVFSIIIIFIAYTVKGLSGFGSGLIAIPLLAFLFPLAFIVPVLGLLSYSGTLMQSFHLRKQVAWHDMLPLLPFSLLGIVIAIWLLVNVDANLLVRSLGIFVLMYSIYSLLPLPDFSGSRKWAVIAGSSGGLVGALFGTGGPFYVIYLKMRQLDKSQFRATIAMIFLVDGGVRIAGYTASGLYSSQVLLLVAILFPVLFAGMYVGHHMHIKIDQKRFNQLISVTLMMSGLMLVYKSIV
ncbi:MAG: sulfite exporter TauE/SafE family protein [Gammaproteobacteria bacterium]|nr:sulfite exporter TauE/SafE family protein [Gammaproteobacteria bacterium]MCW8909399.1 sulfite exporter TauE/SafE family protein [Gammaproteobacteria bacterium]MCW9003795.1 sulfite exporter TauE/SafE family protein [Gammaproteobacteria bacterium]MCW9055194.1 sulfite exporter TauE/SafE family protein [Gammaproteobacteria bacterium]